MGLSIRIKKTGRNLLTLKTPHSNGYFVLKLSSELAQVLLNHQYI